MQVLKSLYIVPLLLGLLACGSRDKTPRDDLVVEYSSDKPDKYANCSLWLSEGDSLRFNTPEHLVLGYPKWLRKGSSGTIFIGSTGQPAMAFSPTGDFLWSVGDLGHGPGEYASNYIFDVDPDDVLYVYDMMYMRIHVFRDGKEYLRSGDVSSWGGDSYFVAAGNDQFFVLNDEYELPDQHLYAVAKSTLNGDILETWGKIPDIARLQATLIGGGIALDIARGLVYHGYMAAPRIYKSTLEGQIIGVLDNEPDYFIHPDLGELDRRLESVNASQLTRTVNAYAMTVSWVRSFHVTNEGVVFQQILEKLNRGSDPLGLYLEVWDAEGYRMASQVPTSDELMYADNRSLYYRLEIEDDKENYGMIVQEYEMKCSQDFKAD